MIVAQWKPRPEVIAHDYLEAEAAYEHTEVPLALTKPIITEAHDRTFQAQGQGWAEWAPSYSPYAESRNKGILWRTGALHAGATSEGSLFQTAHMVVWTGADAPYYWGFHQDGTSKMPARPFLGLDDEGDLEVERVFDSWLEQIAGITAGGSGVGYYNVRDARGRFTKR